jgi:hypothetical protein
VKLCYKTRNITKETYCLLNVAFGDVALSRWPAFEWYKHRLDGVGMATVVESSDFCVIGLRACDQYSKTEPT